MQSFYRKAEGKPERLPWHRESPGRVLVSAVAACTRPARALEVTDFAAPLPFGPTVRGVGYWFRRIGR